MAQPEAARGEGDCHDKQPLFCHLVRIGSYRAVAAAAAEEPAVTAGEPNAVLYPDRLEIELRGLPRLVLRQQDIR